MAENIKVSQLPVASSVNDADIVPIVQGGVTKQATAAKMQRGTTFGKSLTLAADDAAGRQLLKMGRFISILGEGATGDGVTDDWPAFVAAVTAAGSSGVVYFPNIGGVQTTYFFSSVTSGNNPSLSGAYIFSDPGVTISVNGCDYVSYKSIKALSDLTIHVRNRSSDIMVSNNANVSPLHAACAVKLSDGLTASAVDLTTFDSRNYNPASGQSGYIAGTATKSARSVTFSGTETANTIEGVYSAISIGSQLILGVVTSNNASGEVYAQLNYSTGYDTVVIPDITGANKKKCIVRRKIGTGSWSDISTSNLPDAAYGVGSNSSIHLGIKVVSSAFAEIYVNGCCVAQVRTPANIVDVGFAVDCQYYSPVASFHDAVIKTGGWGGGRTRNITVAGDSIAFGEGGSFSFSDLLKTTLIGQEKISSSNVSNIAVSGSKVADVASIIGSTDLTGVDVLVVCAGANDVFVGTSVASYESSLDSIKAACDFAGTRLVVCSIPMSTYCPPGATSLTPARSTYGLGGRLRASIWHWAAINSIEVADLEYGLGAAGVFSYPSTGIDSPSFFDGLHPSLSGTVLAARQVSAAIIRAMDK